MIPPKSFTHISANLVSAILVISSPPLFFDIDTMGHMMDAISFCCLQGNIDHHGCLSKENPSNGFQSFYRQKMGLWRSTIG